LIDQLKDIWIDGELDPIETANWFPKVARKDYQIGLNNTGSGVDDPDQQFFENYGCGSERNYTGYCNGELEKLFVEQSKMSDREKRRRLVWEIDKRLQEDGARPIIYHPRLATCMQPQVKGLTVMVNSQYNGWRGSTDRLGVRRFRPVENPADRKTLAAPDPKAAIRRRNIGRPRPKPCSPVDPYSGRRPTLFYLTRRPVVSKFLQGRYTRRLPLRGW